MAMIERYWGKFEGVVVDNADDDGLCRLEVKVPALLTESVKGCRPALPSAGDGSGLALVPPVGATVWVEFPGGDLERTPVWSGATWTQGNGVEGAGPGTVLLVTPNGHRIEVSDDDEAITLTSSGGASITIGKDSIMLDNGQGATLELSGSSVKLNDDSFSVS
jgi:uncharacterized protein involved in type VI secretion and phage assembly